MSSLSKRHKIELIAVGLIALFFIVIFPLLNAQGVVSNFTINLWGKYLCYALLAFRWTCSGATPGCSASARRCFSVWAVT